ncbi:MAG: NmrA family NAD(P)-binding protein [Bacteroidia bacterium]|nr:NmrA family NAD(P)-binding protein [Bacteroidia bacterium]
MYVITGATGHTGKLIAEALLAAGKPVTAISRTAAHLTDLSAAGAHTAEGSLEDADFLTRTFEGATAVYAMIPPNFATEDFTAYQYRVADALYTAIVAAKVRHVVFLSSVGAHLEAGSGVLLGLRYFEDKLAALTGTHTLSLRAGFFMENFLSSAGLLRNAGILGGFPIQGDIPMPMVHTRDIAAVAARYLLALDFEGFSVQYVAGARDLTFQEAATILGTAVGRPQTPWVQFSYEDARQGMIQNGLQPNMADLYIAFSRTANEGRLAGDYQRTAANTTPTTLEMFSAEFAQAYAQVAGQPA